MSIDVQTQPGISTAEAPALKEGEESRSPVGVVRDRAATIAARVPAVADSVRREATDRVPGAAETVWQGAVGSRRSILAMPAETQRMVAAFSVGLGLGLSIAGAPRIVVAAALAPAVIVGTDILARGAPSA